MAAPVLRPQARDDGRFVRTWSSSTQEAGWQSVEKSQTKTAGHDRLAAAVLIRLRDIVVLKPPPSILHEEPCFLQE